MAKSKFESTRAYDNKNPLNIRYNRNNKWQGQTGSDYMGFSKFKAWSYGYRAAVKILRSYQKRGIKSIGDIIANWAPHTENDTKAYTKAVLEYLNGVFAIEPPEYGAKTCVNLKDREEVVNLLMAMTRVEMGANAAQIHYMKPYAYMGYDLAITRPDFFK